jgi:starch phosphorylase
MAALIRRLVGSEWAQAVLAADGWQALEEVPAKDLWNAHRAQKERLCRFARARLRDQYGRHGQSPRELRAVAEILDPDILTVGFARRFATYKRAGLLFSDLHRVRALMNHPERPVQVILAGKAHPADRPGQELIQSIFHLSQSGDLRGRVVFLENYDMRVARMMVQGCDVWLNTPRRPLEASGTSGMKAAMNGAMNLSIADGWWPEAYNSKNGWIISDGREFPNEEMQDYEDSNSFYDILEHKVIPAYYNNRKEGVPPEWVGMMKESMATIIPQFSAARMIEQYIQDAYMPVATKKGKGA